MLWVVTCEDEIGEEVDTETVETKLVGATLQAMIDKHDSEEYSFTVEPEEEEEEEEEEDFEDEDGEDEEGED